MENILGRSLTQAYRKKSLQFSKLWLRLWLLHKEDWTGVDEHEDLLRPQNHVKKKMKPTGLQNCKLAILVHKISAMN